MIKRLAILILLTGCVTTQVYIDSSPDESVLIETGIRPSITIEKDTLNN